MTRLKVLFADDQIPDERIPEDDVLLTLAKKYYQIPDDIHPETIKDYASEDPFINAFLIMRHTVKTLRDGYDVTVAYAYADAINLIKNNHYDIAIVDLRWDADQNFPHEQSENAGWAICDAIEEADRTNHCPPTFQIVYSSRFDREPHLAMLAAQKSKLPVYKSYNEAGSLALLAAVNFIEKHLSSQSARDTIALETVNTFRQTIQEYLSDALIRTKQWTTITLVLVSISVVLVLLGAAAAIFGYIQVGALTSVSSVLTSAVSILIFRELKRAQENAKDSLATAERNYRAAMKLFREEKLDKSKRKSSK